MLNSIFYGVDQLKYCDYVLHTTSKSQLKNSRSLKRGEEVEKETIFSSFFYPCTERKKQKGTVVKELEKVRKIKKIKKI
jgi:hypothetical protein